MSKLNRNTVSAVLIDDEPLLAEHLGSMLFQIWPQLKIDATVHDGIAGLAAIAEHQPDLIFLDIRMPRMDGLTMAKALCVHDNPPLIIFVTAYDEFAVNAFEHHAVDYLLKPVEELRLARTVEHLKSRLATDVNTDNKVLNQSPSANVISLLIEQLQETKTATSSNWLKLTHLNDTHLVNFNDIIYAKAEEKYTTVVTTTQEYVSRKTIRQLGDRLNSSDFLQISRGTIINLNFLDYIFREPGNYTVAKLKHNDIEFKISRSFAAALKDL